MGAFRNKSGTFDRSQFAFVVYRVSMIRRYAFQQCNLARVIDGMLRCTQEEAVELVGPAGNSGLQPLVGEGFDRFNQSQMIREK